MTTLEPIGMFREVACGDEPPENCHLDLQLSSNYCQCSACAFGIFRDFLHHNLKICEFGQCLTPECEFVMTGPK